MVSGYVREIERYLDDGKRFGREGFLSEISCSDLHVRTGIPYLCTDGVESEGDDVAGGVHLNLGEGRKREVGRRARE